jgi:hypothetical protein
MLKTQQKKGPRKAHIFDAGIRQQRALSDNKLYCQIEHFALG